MVLSILHGNYDLNYDNSLDAPLRYLSDVPDKIIYEILSKAKLFELFKIQKVSRGFRSFVNNHHVGFKSINISFKLEKIEMLIDGKEIVYAPKPEDADPIVDEEKTQIVIAENFTNLAIYDLKLLMNMHLLKLQDFTLGFYPNDNVDLQSLHFPTILNLLQSCQTLSSVKSCSAYCMTDEAVHSFICCFQSGTLEEIRILTEHGPEIYLENICLRNQWKMAKNLTAGIGNSILPIQSLFHFEKFLIHKLRITVDDAIKIKEMLDKPNNLKDGYFRVEIANKIELARVFGTDYIDRNGEITMYYQTEERLKYLIKFIPIALKILRSD